MATGLYSRELESRHRQPAQQKPLGTTPGWRTVFGCRAKQAALLLIIATVLSLCAWSLVLRDAVQVGADEGFELAKALLVSKGHLLYAEIWNDQPPLHTWMVAWVLRHISTSVAAPRVITIVFAVLLVWGLNRVAARGGSPAVGWLSAGLLVASPGFLELGCSCMLEIPAVAVAMSALVILTGVESEAGGGRKILTAHEERRAWNMRCIGRICFAGPIFGAALQIKLTAIFLMPAAAITWWLGARSRNQAGRGWLQEVFCFVGGLVLAFSTIHFLIGDNSYFHQLWSSHFSGGKSTEYGSAQDYPFDWMALVKNWDLSAPALLGCAFIGSHRYREVCLVPMVWLGATLGVMAVHRPWWPYYYVHLAIPMSWLAALALREAWQKTDPRLHPAKRWMLCVLISCIGLWLGARVCGEVFGMRRLPQIHSSLVIAELGRFRPYVTSLYSEQPVYSFHAGIPMLPHLAVVPRKRFWSGDMTNAKLEAELRTARPGLILLANDGRETPLESLVRSQYRLVYQDQNHRLYAVPEAAIQVEQKRASEETRHHWTLPQALPAD
jgi:hypothetical protein